MHHSGSHDYFLPVKYFRTDEGSNIAYVEEGNGSTVILFIHGLSSYIPAFKFNFLGLSKNFRCIAIDLPGYGKSTAVEKSGDLNYCADIIAEFIKELGLSKVVLTGHSMGGFVTLLTTIKYPDLIDKIILLAPAGFESFEVNEITALKSIYTEKNIGEKNKERITASFENNFYKMPSFAEFMIRDYISLSKTTEFSNYIKVVVRSLYFMLDNPFISQINKIKKDVLLIYGDKDKLIPHPLFHRDWNSDDIFLPAKKMLNNITIQKIKDCGHFIQMEKYVEVNNFIERFLIKKPRELLS